MFLHTTRVHAVLQQILCCGELLGIINRFWHSCLHQNFLLKGWFEPTSTVSALYLLSVLHSFFTIGWSRISCVLWSWVIIPTWCGSTCRFGPEQR